MINEKHQKLIDALRSGKYPQTKRALRNDCGYCVMGVASDIYDPSGWGPPEAGEFGWNSCWYIPHRAVVDFFGFPESFVETLMEKNDEGVSFNELADFIESSIKDGSAFQ